MNICTLNRACMRIIALMALPIQVAVASELIYTPVNPSFGGNPNNAAMLLNTAQAQNGFKAPKAPALTPMQRFQNNLQQAILNNLATQIKNSIFGTDGTQITPGTYDAGNYTVTVIGNDDGSLTITTIDNTNGATATFDVAPTL